MTITIVLLGVLLIFCILIPLTVGLILLLVFRSQKKSQPTPLPVSPAKAQPADVPDQALSQVLKDYRIKSGMTQELVAERLEISRQAVSKWENGTSEPSTANLIALAQLYGVDPGELLKNVQA